VTTLRGKKTTALLRLERKKLPSCSRTLICHTFLSSPTTLCVSGLALLLHQLHFDAAGGCP
jgi:hypothetical protein